MTDSQGKSETTGEPLIPFLIGFVFLMLLLKVLI